MKPKFHKLDECIRSAIRSHRNPGWSWTFSDESWIGSMANLQESCHSTTAHSRVMQRWLAHFFAEASEGRRGVGA
eukprot:1234266-Alexandrium_andersonii.AAC.1